MILIIDPNFLGYPRLQENLFLALVVVVLPTLNTWKADSEQIQQVGNSSK